MPTIPVRDTTLYQESCGTGPPLLFIHGMCGDARVWEGQVERLSDRFTCITYDRRGHTRSTLGTEPESVATHAADAAALIEALGLVRPALVGSSGGARIAVELARTRPELLAGAILSEPPILDLEPVAGRGFLDDVRALVAPAARTGGPRAAVDAFFPYVCGGLWRGLDEPAKDRYRANGHMMLAEFSGAPYDLTVDDVARIAVPTLVIAGTQSHPALRAIAATLARTLPGARMSSWSVQDMSPTPSARRTSLVRWGSSRPSSRKDERQKPALGDAAPWAPPRSGPRSPPAEVVVPQPGGRGRRRRLGELGQPGTSLGGATPVRQGHGLARDPSTARVVGGGGQFGLGEPRFVVTERRALRQGPGDQGCCRVRVTEGEEDEGGSRGGPAGEQVEVLGHGERVPEGAQRLVEVARSLCRHTDRAPGGGGPTPVTEPGGDGQRLASVRHGLAGFPSAASASVRCQSA